MSMPYNGKRFTFQQPDGTQVDVRGYGDQHHAVFETLDGYTVIRDPHTGFYSYAELTADGQAYRSTGVPPQIRSGAALGLPRNVRVPAGANRRLALGPTRHLPGKTRWEERREQKLNVRRAALRSGLVLAPPSRATLGDYVGLCLLVDFPDVRGTIPATQVDDFCNKPGYSGFGNNGSMCDYFRDVSHGKVNYTKIVAGYYTTRNARSYYTDPNIAQPIRTFELIAEAVAHFIAQGFDFSRLTADSDGYVYALSVFYAGSRVNNWAEGLWPHSYRLDNPISVGPGRRLRDYQITDMGSELSLATFCHENGHMVCDFPDLYDYGYESNGVGDYCLMCAGGPNEKNPSQVSAYLKYEAGWASKVTPLTNGLSAVAPAQGNEFFIHPKNATEYYIIENRHRSGRDSHLPDSGLAIWHVDTDGSNNNEQMTASQHYECALVQADNRFELERRVNNGNVGDLFTGAGRSTFDDSTQPASRWWDGTSSGLSISSIGSPGTQVTFQVGSASGGGGATVTGRSTPNKQIPDFSAAGVKDDITLAAGAQDAVESIRVAVDIQHTYRGDLRLTLMSPSNISAALLDRAGGSANDVSMTFDVTNTPALSGLANQPVAGKWALHVQDLAAADTGVLKTWSIEIQPKPGGGGQGPIELRETPGIRIPDNNPAGITRVLQCAQTGKVGEVQVDLDIAHTYIRDLVVTLESPKGTKLDLHHRSGGSADNIIRSFKESDTPALAGFRGEAVQGTWKLHVSDHEAIDEGKLTGWALTLFRQP